jgi:hypothetical protein
MDTNSSVKQTAIDSTPLADQVARLEKENRKLRLKLKQAQTIIDVQKKVSQMLEQTQDLIY